MTRTKSKPRFRDIALLLGAMFAVVGVALFAINATDDPPALDALQRDRGMVGDTRRHSGNRSAPYLTVEIGGGVYTISSYSRGWLDSIAFALPRGEVVTVWSREVPNGSGQIWQLRKGDSVVVSYDERRAAKLYRNDRTRQLALGMIGIGITGLLLGGAIRPRVRGQVG